MKAFIGSSNQEQDRLQLEQNLQEAETSFQLSDMDSIEFPRHGSAPAEDIFDTTHRGWSYHDDREDEYEHGVHPYVYGEPNNTVSTAAHHASALTISAGLRGNGGPNASLSGAEYDPERPLKDFLGDGKIASLSMFDAEASRSRYPAVGLDPLVVDNTEELDRVLQSGYSAEPMNRSTSSAGSDTESNRRPKLADALRRVSFSPRRPRSPLPQHSPHHRTSDPEAFHFPRPSPRRAAASPLAQDASTPRASARSRRANIFPSYGNTSPTQPQVRLQPPTPSTAGSKFTRMARSVTKDIQAASEQEQQDEADARALSIPAQNRRPERNPFHESNPSPARNKRAPARRNATNNNTAATSTRIHLPDVTGLTAALESPLKPNTSALYRGFAAPAASEAKVIQTLNNVQKRLNELEAENGISRRRVRELEMELEVCGRVVERERTVMEREKTFGGPEKEKVNVLWREREERNYQSKGKERAREDDTSMRYREVVEEKKALEALISSLRTHLTRLTSELSSHQELLTELTSTHESNATAFKEKAREVDRLKEEVERLAGEVEVLRGVVEEGLKERRAVREIDTSFAPDGNEGEYEETEEAQEQEQEHEERFDQEPLTIPSEPEEEEFDPSLHSSTISHSAMRAAAAASRRPGSNLRKSSLGSSSGRSYSQSHQSDVEEEEERDHSLSHSQHSRSHSILQQSLSRSGSRSGSERAQSPVLSVHSLQEQQQRPRQLLSPRLLPKNATRTAETKAGPSSILDDRLKYKPRLERLFRSAPNHDARTCTVCVRGGGDACGPSGIGYTYARNGDKETGNPVGYNVVQPPQTMLSKVVRELEDDFTHYKSVYVELAEQYAVMNAISDVAKRNMLARHLREVIDVLEQKGDQIASLYELLTFKDKPI